MKKALVGLMAITLVATLAGVGTFAIFRDTQTVESNFEAGTLKLDVQGPDEEVQSFSFENIKPGDSSGWHGATQSWGPNMVWTVKNTGTIDGTLTVSIENIQDQYWPDAKVPGADTSNIVLSVAGSGDPRLSTQLRPQVRVNGVWKTESSGLHNLNDFEVDLPAGESVTIAIAWSFYSSAGNEYQGARTEIDVKFYLEQND